MAKYTVELGEIVKSGHNIFDFDYDFYDPQKKTDFEQKFINHFYFREIGFETVGRFEHYLKCKCDETLPYYNMLFRTALIDYEKTVNYNVTETFTRGVNKTDNVEGNSTTNTKATEIQTENKNNIRSTNISGTDDKTNTVESTNNRAETGDISKNENITETSETKTHDDYSEDVNINKTSKDTINNKKVSSDTPSSLLSMSDIEHNVYATKVELDNNTLDNEENTDNVTTRIDDNTINLTHDVNNDSSENRNLNTKDTLNTTEHDLLKITHTEGATENLTGSNNNTANYDNTLTATQKTTGAENETSTRNIKGSYGVITEADMLKKHIDLQKTLSTIMVKFFNECEDLFMQLF